MGPDSQPATIALDGQTPMLGKDPGQGDGRDRGSRTSAAAISASTLASIAGMHAVPSSRAQAVILAVIPPDPTAPDQTALARIAPNLACPDPTQP
jgi:hypothetical protein